MIDHAEPATLARHDTARGRERGRGRAQAWPLAAACCAAAALIALAAFHETVFSLVSIWARSDTFSHGFLIPLISGFLVWRSRHRLAVLVPQPSLLGLVAVTGLSLVWFVARIAGIAVVEQLAFVGILQSLVLAIMGWQVVRAIVFPLFFLVFMVPFGEFLIPPLQDVTADFVVWWLQLIGIPIFRDGIFLYIPGGAFEVAEACAGLRFLIAMIVLGLLFAHVTYTQWWRRIVFMLMAVTIPIIANGFRALMIVLVAHWTDHTVAVGIDHIVYGWIFLTFVMILVLGAGMLLREQESADGGDDGDRPLPPRRPASRTALLASTAAAVVLLLTGPGYALWRDSQAPAPMVAPLALPQTAGGWTLQGPAGGLWRPVFAGAHGEALMAYGDGGRTVDVYVAFYRQQRQGAEAVNAANALFETLPEDPTVPAPPLAGLPWMRVGSHALTLDVAGRPLPVWATHIVSSDGRRRLVLPLYWVNGEITQSRLEAKLLEVAAVFTGTSEAAAIVVSAPFTETPAVAAAALGDFAAALPALRQALTAAAAQ